MIMEFVIIVECVFVNKNRQNRKELFSTFFENSSNLSQMNVFLTNRSRSPKNTATIKTHFLSVNKLTLTVIKIFYINEVKYKP